MVMETCKNTKMSLKSKLQVSKKIKKKWLEGIFKVWNKNANSI